ncbi:TetR/AcrR family transcriptional regulator [Streptomyces boninensis]|uniref:TetR/AcrR family transcriptional regulator n=1 Tax=Streptomyces boninensis TaxID=2039455 RepID=UPI003B21C651
MARSKEFDPDAALQAALELFWRRGYEATSMADLVDHLGIARASIYGTFGSKRELYEKALASYAGARNPAQLAALERPGPALDAVRAYVRGYVGECVHDDEQRGCFVTNTAVELAPHDADAARVVLGTWDAMESALTAALDRAAAAGELPAGRDPRGLARMLVVLLQGMRVVGKTGGDPARLRDASDTALSLLDG